jgi:superfamily II DNA or RNA helicase
MKQTFKGWAAVADYLHHYANNQSETRLNKGQRSSLHAIADRLPNNGVVIADEVGMGKTRIAVEVTRAVIESGGRVGILVPPGLGYQWQRELRGGGVEAQPILRSLWAYLKAWELDQPKAQQVWFDQSAVMVSHAFTNWRLGENSAPWRWALLPELYAHWRKRVYSSYPRYYHGDNRLSDLWVRHAAKSISDAIPDDESNPAWQLLNALAEQTSWPGALDAGEYGRNENLRPWLERAVGLGLGVFDLVILDEAHKNRGDDGSLSRLLNCVIMRSTEARCLAMTATPVELNIGQWGHTLSRIGLQGATMDAINKAIENYAVAIKRIRLVWRSSEEAREHYRTAASEFQQALSPYLLRRDKREDSMIQRYVEHSKQPFESYRQEREINVDIAGLSLEWKKAVCAAEALSVASQINHSDKSLAKAQRNSKLLRLTIGNGHGIAALLDQVKSNEEDKFQEEHDLQVANEGQNPVLPEVSMDAKRKARAQWWLNNIQTAFAQADEPLFDHPAILAAVQSIEETAGQGEKVLVFGRFTRPLRALVNLLNAREMLRRLEQDLPWPQSKVHGDKDAGIDTSEWSAARAAHRQLKSQVPLDQLDDRLKKQYDRLSYRHEKLRKELAENLRQGLKEIQASARILALADKLDDPAHGQVEGSNERHPLILVSRAIAEELLDDSSDELKPTDLARRFIQVIEAAGDQDAGEEDTEETYDEAEIANLWKQLSERLHEEFNRPQGGFARLMYGGTAPHSRRMIQLAFNRQSSFPKVLVAQSMVGREGLNLHEACRIVVLLHPEWNPGVVEQQIGRVDRVGSHWGKKLDEAIKSGNDLPRIEIRPVIFSGTYDEYNWTVLRERWDDLRAQLHGVVVPSRLKLDDPDSQRIVDELSASAPKFSPCK